jgi:hypothetical protein
MLLLIMSIHFKAVYGGCDGLDMYLKRVKRQTHTEILCGNLYVVATWNTDKTVLR